MTISVLTSYNDYIESIKHLVLYVIPDHNLNYYSNQADVDKKHKNLAPFHSCCMISTYL